MKAPLHLLIAYGLLFAGACVSVLLMHGCKVGPDYKRPEPNLPSRWGESDSNEKKTANLAAWWKDFNDPVLDGLVVDALKGNLDLRQAQARLLQARAQRGIIAADLWPMLNTSGSYRRVHSSTISGSTAAGPNTLASSLGTGTNTSGIGLFGGGSSRTFDLYQAGFDASWEIDVFGQTRRNIESANADIAAALEDRNDVLISLISEVAINYIDLRAFMQRISIARKNLNAQAKTLELVRQQLEAGTATDLQVAQAQAQFATTAAQVPAFETSARQLMHQLGTLLGKEPMAFEHLLSQDAPIPSDSPVVPPGLPSDLLRQRPDIRRAERQLASATAQVGVAVADWFPKFSLTGAAGRQSTTFSGLGKSGSGFWSFGPAINWPIFDAGRIRSNIKLQKALRLQASINYQQTVLNALREVEDALVAYARQQDRRKDLADAVIANRRAVELASQLYTYGRTDFLNVLTAQASLYSAEDALAQADQGLSSDAVTLYKALGGGWQNIK